jgi:glutathione S-transferase
MGEDFAKEWEKDYPTCWAWNERLSARDAVKKCKQDRQKAIESSKH